MGSKYWSVKHIDPFNILHQKKMHGRIYLYAIQQLFY